MPANTPGGGNFGRAGSMQSGFGNLLGFGGNSPGIDYDSINTLLEQFGGLRVGAGAPTGLFENTAWGGRHSNLAGGFDNALIALSNMGPTGATAGENISNVARGLQSIGPTRRMQAMAPTLQALQLAGEVAKLQQAKAYMGRESAMAQYYSGRNDASMYGADQRLNAALVRQQMLAGKEGMILSDGTVGLPDVDQDGKIIYTSHPEIDPKEFKRQNQRKQLSGILGGGVEGAIIQGMLGDDPDSYASKSGKGRQAYFKDANNILLQHKTAAAGVGAQSRATEGDVNRWSRDQQTQFKNVFSGAGTANIREKRIDQRAQELFMSPNFKGGLDGARRQAEQESTQHQGQLQQAWSEFSLMDPDEQRQRGGIMGYLGSKGYNPTTDSFSAPRTGAPAANPTPRTTAAPNSSNLSPNVQAIIDSLNKPR